MLERSEGRPPRRRISPVAAILLALAGGVTAGALMRAWSVPCLAEVLEAADVIGGLWVGALRMTIIPLVVGLIIAGVASSASTAAGGGFPARALMLFLFLYLLSAAATIILAPALLFLWPLSG